MSARRVLAVTITAFAATGCGGGKSGKSGSNPPPREDDASGKPSVKEVTLAELVERVAPGFAAETHDEAKMKAQLDTLRTVDPYFKGYRLDNPGPVFSQEFTGTEKPKATVGVSCGALPSVVMGMGGFFLPLTSDYTETRDGQTTIAPTAFAGFVRKREYMSSIYDTPWTETLYLGMKGQSLLFVEEKTGKGESNTLDYNRCASLLDLATLEEKTSCASYSAETSSWHFSDWTRVRSHAAKAYKSDMTHKWMGPTYNEDRTISVNQVAEKSYALVAKDLSATVEYPKNDQCVITAVNP